jgi:hypothetical protein
VIVQVQPAIPCLLPLLNGPCKDDQVCEHGLETLCALAVIGPGAVMEERSLPRRLIELLL